MASFGETLKRERELREISLRQISEATKINIRYLEALEENRFDALPGGLFNKGFIRAYATYIGIDSEAIVNSYLHELSARQTGTEAASSRGPSNLHRPQEVPQRRAAQATAADRAIAPAITLAPAPRRTQEARTPSVPESTAAAHAPAHGDGRTALAAVEREPHHAPRPAVTGIEVADPQAPASSRVLVWVLSLVAATGVLFLIFSLVRGTMPGPRRPPDSPAAREGAVPGAPEGGAEAPAPESKVGPGAADSAAVLPEVSSQSPLILGAVGTPSAKTASPGPPAETASRSAPAKRIPPLPVATQPVGGRSGEGASADDDRAARGPMKIVVGVRSRTYVVLVCDGREVLSRFMDAGETERAKCDTVIRVSASDAGVVNLSVNGDTCLPLGDPGTRAYGYTIRIDDYARICPSPGGGADGRP